MCDVVSSFPRLNSRGFNVNFVAIYFVACNQTTQLYYSKTLYLNQLEHMGRLRYLTVLSQVKIYCQHQQIIIQHYRRDINILTIIKIQNTKIKTNGLICGKWQQVLHIHSGMDFQELIHI